MKNPKDLLEKFQRASDILHESTLISVILSYARSGHASTTMIQASIDLLKKHIEYAKRDNDSGILLLSKKLMTELERALEEGLKSLRIKEGPTAESLKVEIPLAEQRIAAGHRVRRQMRCAAGIIDIYDLTADELIECKLIGTNASLGEAAGQLQRYRGSFPGAALTIAVLSIDSSAVWLAEVLKDQGISILELNQGAF